MSVLWISIGRVSEVRQESAGFVSSSDAEDGSLRGSAAMEEKEKPCLDTTFISAPLVM
jgi:hypothetical protein